MTHHKLDLRVQGGRVVKGERVTVAELGTGHGGHTGVDCHRLMVFGGQLIDKVKTGVRV